MKLTLLALCLAFVGARKSYEGYQLIEVVPTNDAELARLNFWFLNTELDFWEEPSGVGNPVHILVSPESLADVDRLFQYTVLNDHIGQDIEEEVERLSRNKNMNYNYADFNDYDAILAEVDRQIEEFCPAGFTCSKDSAGDSLEGEPQYYISITSGSNRPAIWIDSTIHAREWLATTTMMWTIRRLLEWYGTEGSDPLDTYDFYIMPVVNPDGFKFTFTDRLWRKNRSFNSGSTCRGVDLNRNFDYEFGTSGTSTNPCSQTFRGPSAASEPEVAQQQALMNQLVAEGVNLRAGVSMHTYGQYWLMPWGHQIGGSCAPEAGFRDLTDAMAQATMDEYNTFWRPGGICPVLYPASGNTIDYMHAVTGIPYTFLPELRGNNFVVSPALIEPSFREIWAGLEVLFARAEN